MSTPQDITAVCLHAPMQAMMACDKLASWLQAKIESTQDGVIVAGQDGSIVLLNAEAERLLQVEAGHLIGSSVHSLLTQDKAGSAGASLWKDIPEATELPEALRFKRQVRCQRPDGTTFEANATIARLQLEGYHWLTVMLNPLRKSSVRSRSRLEMRSVASQTVNELEKQRVSKQLYDDLGQGLSVLKLDMDWLEKNLSQEASVCPERVAQMQGLLDQIIQRTRTIASALRPPLLDDLGLLPAIAWMARNFQKKTAIACRVDAGSLKGSLNDPVKSAVFRIVQESLDNVEQHARASRVDVQLQQSESTLEVTVRDDGIGMTEDKLHKAGCFGLIAMRERIHALGGKMQLHESAPQGLTIRVSLPLSPLSLGS